MFELDYHKKAEEISAWINNTVREAGFKDVIVALSGGIDSAVSATLAVRALGKEHVSVLLLPYGTLSDKGTQDAKDVAKFLDLSEDHIFVENIQKAVDVIAQDADSENNTLRKGNIMARVRMTYLYDLAKKLNVLVVGTENKSEFYLSYFTRFGDEASDIEPIRGLYKTQVWEMGKYLQIPKHVIEKAPSAGLWDSQTDEGEFGFSYTDADMVLYHHFDEGLAPEAIIDLGIPKETVERVLQWVAKNDFKHHLPHIFQEK